MDTWTNKYIAAVMEREGLTESARAAVSFRTKEGWAILNAAACNMFLMCFVVKWPLKPWLSEIPSWFTIMGT